MREPLSYGIARSADIVLGPGLEWTEGRLASPVVLAGHRAAQRKRGRRRDGAEAGGSLAPTTVAAFPFRTPTADVRADVRIT